MCVEETSDDSPIQTSPQGDWFVHIGAFINQGECHDGIVG